MAERTYERVPLGNHVQGYECRLCYAVSASEFAAKRHAEWHRDPTRVTPPGERDNGLPFDPPGDADPTCPTCGQALFTHGILGRCTPPESGDTNDTEAR